MAFPLRTNFPGKDILPGSVPISGAGKIADMKWIWEVYAFVISSEL
jgi:hypothetical protein